MNNEQIKINPNWSNVSNLIYNVYRKDYFHYGDSIRTPIENSYTVELKIKSLTNEPEFEITYPKGIWYLLTSFQPFVPYIGLAQELIVKEGISFKYILNSKREIQVIDTQKLDKYLKVVNRKLKNRANLKNEFLLEDDNDKIDYITRDIELIHQTFDAPIPVNFKSSVINPEWSPMNLLRTKKQSDHLHIDYLYGFNLFSVDEKDWTDFKQIKTDFFNEQFDIDNYNKITLRRKIFAYSLNDKILNHYKYDLRIVSPKMKKIETIEIKKVN